MNGFKRIFGEFLLWNKFQSELLTGFSSIFGELALKGAIEVKQCFGRFVDIRAAKFHKELRMVVRFGKARGSFRELGY